MELINNLEFVLGNCIGDIIGYFLIYVFFLLLRKVFI